MKNLKKKAVKVFASMIMAIMISINVFPPIAAQAEWKCNTTGWWWTEGNGYAQNGWRYISNKWYYFNSDGYMATGWKLINNTWYYLNPAGDMATGWVKDGNAWYYMYGSGAMATGWVNDGGTWYYLNSNGAMATGWKFVNGQWYYMENNGAMITGWKRDGDKWYYLTESGAMATGEITMEGAVYIFEENGALKNVYVPEFEHTHTWEDVTTTIEHSAVTHEEDVYENQQVLVTPAWDEQVYTGTIIECIQCGFQTSDNDAMTDHMIENGHSCTSYDNYETVHHDAVYETQSVKVGTRTVVDQEAWTETVVTGQKCTGCGATK